MLSSVKISCLSAIITRPSIRKMPQSVGGNLHTKKTYEYFALHFHFLEHYFLSIKYQVQLVCRDIVIEI